LNIRTQAVPAALNDAMWERYALGVEYTAKDPVTQQPAIRNPFWHRAPSPAPGVILPSLEDLVQRKTIVLVCDFALGHLAKRLAAKRNGNEDEVHRELRNGFVPGSFAVPSGIFGLARAQNAGCAYVRM
jgi:intracellular sulfur oxidation DsrE/DsrF family protein